MKYFIPILSIIISFISLGVALPRSNNLGFDYLGVIVAIISLATAFAVGFQIWNALSLETRLKELKVEVMADNKAQIESLEKKLKVDYSKKMKEMAVLDSYRTAIITATIALTNKSYDRALYSYVQALEFEMILLNEYHENLPTSVEPSIHSIINEQSIKITDPEEQKYIIKTIIDSGKEELIEKIGVIKSKIFSSEN